MAKKDVADLDFLYNDDGELELSGFDSDEDELEEEPEDEEEDTESEEESEEEDSERSEDGNIVSLAARIGSIETTLQSLPDIIGKAIGAAMKPIEEEEEIPDELDSKAIVNILSKRITKAVDAKIGSVMDQHKPALTQAKLTADFQNAAAKYGQSFVDRMPLVSKVMLKSNGNLGVEEAWAIVKDFGSSKSKANRKDIISKTKSRSVDADSKDSIGDTESARKPFKKLEGKNDSEVFDKAFRAAMAKNLKRRTA